MTDEPLIRNNTQATPETQVSIMFPSSQQNPYFEERNFSVFNPLKDGQRPNMRPLQNANSATALLAVSRHSKKKNVTQLPT